MARPKVLPLDQPLARPAVLVVRNGPNNEKMFFVGTDAELDELCVRLVRTLPSSDPYDEWSGLHRAAARGEKYAINRLAHYGDEATFRAAPWTIERRAAYLELADAQRSGSPAACRAILKTRHAGLTLYLRPLADPSEASLA